MAQRYRLTWRWARVLPKPPDGYCWEILASTSSDAARTAYQGGACDGFAVSGGSGIVLLEKELQVVRMVNRDELGGDGDLDAQAMSFQMGSEGERRRVLKDSANLIVETTWPYCPVWGPGITRWCLRFWRTKMLSGRSPA
ncbi:unnamed protein product [Prorocentrum cordatum]|uniref:Uncharacterized protein n=1 Tax=Prorocentrum cordatum TaxID=2364126 RepID=A0ABN9UDH7_9DINO|nr:unnamed protein product [Polarella glacialis]